MLLVDSKANRGCEVHQQVNDQFHIHFTPAFWNHGKIKTKGAIISRKDHWHFVQRQCQLSPTALVPDYAPN